ncbi:RNA recognition motif domain-containing protein [Coxiella endosymbiont of Amblyomma nuttalli]|uniref:RNA recognition motif domain-containing protein n=1 Tax=Coxiella endosymbiont of Amblyomma nuttalli TaxID=2749996 RepID=UPI001BAD3688|nr:RNA-binding protein [Coxiella endosymbiont of Amblyomma nuttalli]QTS83959.1 RNA recognition motif protein [Coxiella endosymbiont of Amblyomma nuttalli]
MSQNKIYVGSLSYDVTAGDLQSFFGQYGDIEDARVIMDRDTGKSKGFAFITFANHNAAQAALLADGTEMQGRKIRVNIARDNPSSSGRGGRGRNGGGRSSYRF